MPLSPATVTLPRGMKTHFKCMGARLDKATSLSNETLSVPPTGLLLWWWDLSVLHGQNIMTVFELSFILTINVRFL